MELAQCAYQLPRLTRMWSHLERQAGGRVRGMGEKQLEIDKRLLRSRMAGLRRNLDDTRRQFSHLPNPLPLFHPPALSPDVGLLAPPLMAPKIDRSATLAPPFPMGLLIVCTMYTGCLRQNSFRKYKGKTPMYVLFCIACFHCLPHLCQGAWQKRLVVSLFSEIVARAPNWFVDGRQVSPRELQSSVFKPIQ